VLFGCVGPIRGCGDEGKVPRGDALSGIRKFPRVVVPMQIHKATTFYTGILLGFGFWQILAPGFRRFRIFQTKSLGIVKNVEDLETKKPSLKVKCFEHKAIINS
jgi:hypothetical protein